jgi:single-strand DNA-binding protein
MISVTAVGNVGQDAELKQLGEQQVCRFSVASTERRKDGESTTWLRCDLWGSRGAKLCEYLTKGTRVAVAGTLSAPTRDGKTYLNVRVSEVELLGQRATNAPEAGAAERAPAPQPKARHYDDEDLGDGIPF